MGEVKLSDEHSAAMATIAADLQERTKLKYLGDCKCGQCQLVPLALIEAAVAALAYVTRGTG